MNCLDQLQANLENIRQNDQFYYLLNTLRKVDFPAYIHSLNTALYFSKFTHHEGIFQNNKDSIVNTLLLHNIGLICIDQDSNLIEYSYIILKNYYSDTNVIPEILKGKQKRDLHFYKTLHTELQPEIDVCNIVIWFDELTWFMEDPVSINQALKKIKQQQGIHNSYLVEMFVQWVIQNKQWVKQRMDECSYIHN